MDFSPPLNKCYSSNVPTGWVSLLIFFSFQLILVLSVVNVNVISLIRSGWIHITYYNHYLVRHICLVTQNLLINGNGPGQHSVLN